MQWSIQDIQLNDMPIIRMASTQTKASVDIYLFGATLTSWCNNDGRENIFVSSLALFNGVKAIRGGIPIVFPQFGQPLKTMAQHGFARNSLWSVQSQTYDDTSATTVLCLTDNGGDDNLILIIEMTLCHYGNCLLLNV
jgi:glucose-6-phosphate 1-epimerase